MPIQIVSEFLSDQLHPVEGAETHDVLTAESNHRIANNLTLIAGMLRLHAREIMASGRTLKADEARLLLEEVGEKVQTVGRLNRLLAHAKGGRIDLGRYLNDIAEAAIGSMSVAGEMTLVHRPWPLCEAQAQQAMLIGFIVGELVTNAVKYAHPAGVPGKLHVSCESRPGGMVMVQVSDDGVGLPEGFDPRKGGGLGMRTVRALADQLGATLTFDSSGVGLSVRLLTPLARN